MADPRWWNRGPQTVRQWLLAVPVFFVLLWLTASVVFDDAGRALLYAAGFTAVPALLSLVELRKQRRAG